MTTDNLPARHTPPAMRRRPAPHHDHLQVIDLQPLRVTDEGWIRHVEFMHLPANRLTLNGPLHEVRQIIALLRRAGEVVRTNDPAPSPAGILVTLTLTPASAPGRVTVSARPPTVRPWTARRKAVVFGGVIPGVLAAGLVLALLWPLPTVIVSAVLLLLAVRRYRAKSRQQRRSNVPHVAIHHVD